MSNPPAEPIAPPRTHRSRGPVPLLSLKQSRAYRWRIPLSAASVLAGVGLAVALSDAPVRGTVVSRSLDGVGWVVLVAGVAVRLWSAACLGGRKSRKLVDVGPYSICRNPLYVGTLLIAVSQVFFYRSLWATLGLLAPAALYVLGVVPAEERKLAARLGDEYADYCRRVPRWWPRIGQLGSAVVGGGQYSRSFRLELMRTPCWLALPFVAEGLFLSRLFCH